MQVIGPNTFKSPYYLAPLTRCLGRGPRDVTGQDSTASS